MVDNRSYRTFLNKVRTYDPEQLIRRTAWSAAMKLSEPDKLSLETAKFFKYPEGAFLDFMLSGIVRAAFETGGSGVYRRDKTPSVRDLGRLQDMFLSCSAGEPMESIDDFHRFFFRTAFLQFPTRRGSWMQISRALLIHSEQVPQSSFDTGAEFKTLTGLTQHEFTQIGLSLFTLACFSRDGLLPVQSLTTTGIAALSGERIEAFLRLTSASLEELGAENSTIVSLPGFEIYDYNPLVARPIVRLSSGRFSLPVPGLLLERVTDGIYYDLADEYDQEFLRYLGAAYEQYIGRLFRHLDAIDLREQEEYGPKKARRRTTDWLVGNGRQAMIIECKTKRLRRGSPTPARSAQLADDLKKGVVSGVRQLMATEEAIRNGQVFEGYQTASVYPFVTTLGDCFLFNSDPVRSIVRDEAGIADADFEYQIASVSEIEELAAQADVLDIFEIVREKMDSADKSQYDLSTMFRDADPRPHPLLQKTLDDFLRSFRASVDDG